MDICQCSDASLVAESRTSGHDSEAGYAVEEKAVRASESSKEILGIKKTVDEVRLGSFKAQEKQVKLLPKKDALRQLHKASLEESARKLQAMNKELDFEFTKHGKVQLAELASMVKTLKKEMEIVEAVELDVSREALWDMVKEGSSLRSLLESLKLKLETFLRQKPEQRDKKENSTKMLKRGSEFEHCPVEEGKGGGPWTGMAEVFEGEKNKADLLRNKSCRAALHAAEQQKTAAGEVYKEAAGHSRNLNQMTTLSEGTDAVCASNSESCAKIMVSGEELDSSREKQEESNKLAEGEVVAAMSHVDADPTESSFPEFSIRNFVSTARSKDIKMNWPFSRRSLKLCLKHGVKNLLPPFQGLDSLPNNFSKECLAETVLPAERSSLDEKPVWLKNHPESALFYRGFDQKPALHCTDSNSSPSGDQDFALKATAHSQSEMESVSTSKVPLSEVSEKGAAVPAVRQKTKDASIFIPNKKRRVIVKLGAKVDRKAAEDIASTCTVPPEAMAPKTCPVCGNFSSSSNTTLNAHIDQCLSVEPNSDWMKSSKTNKPRIKPRKIRLMSDICATAPCCTLEDLDIRNGRISVADADLPSHANKVTEGRNQRESLRLVKDPGEASAVYIDSNGTKIRILSKTNDASLIPKGLKELKVKKSLKKGKRSKFFSSNKKHLAKNLKLSKVYVTKACVGGKANLTVRRKHQEEELTQSIKFQEQNKVTDSGNSIQGLCLKTTALPENNRRKGKRGRPKCKVRATRDLLAESHHSCFANSNIGKDIKKSSTNTGIDSVPNSMRKTTSSCKVVVDEKGQGSHGGKSMTSSPLFEGPVYGKSSNLDTVSNQFTRENCCEPEVSEATQMGSSPDKEVEIRDDAVGKNDLFSHAKKTLSKGFHDPKGGMKLPSLGKTMPPSGQLFIATSTYSRANKSHMDSIDEATVASSSEIGGQFSLVDADAVHHHDENELTGTDSSAKLPTGDVVASFSRSSDPELHRVTNASGTESSLLQFAGNLFVAGPSIHLNQPCLSDIPDMFYTTEGGTDRMDHNSEDIEKESSFSLVESIPIPGPPGSYLPSFRDSCFEYLQGSSSLTTSWLQSQDAPDVDRFNSDSSISGASTISGSTVANANLGASEKPPHLVPEKVLLVPMCERTESLADNVIMNTVMAGVEAEKLASGVESSKGGVAHREKESPILKDDCQPCCCSQKEGIAWSATLNVQECQLSRPSMITTTVEADLGSHLETRTAESCLSSSVKEMYENLSYASAIPAIGSSLTKDNSNDAVPKSPSPSDTDSIVLSPPPVLRLMGKDLMVLNNDEHATPRSQSSLNGSAGAQAPASTRLLMGRVYPSHDTNPSSSSHVVDPHIMPVQHFKPGFNNPINMATPYKMDVPAAEQRLNSRSRGASYCS